MRAKGALFHHNKGRAMTKRYPFLQFGEEVAGYHVPVLNEREIRAAAGILFVCLGLALMFILFRQDFLLVKYVLAGFLTDFIIRVLINPAFSPTLILGRLIVRRQPPEYVGAAPKRFAWAIGLFLSSLMFVLLVLLNSYSMITSVTCFICLTFLFMETAFGICAGCFVYHLFSTNASACIGGQCGPKRKGAMLPTSRGQLASLFSFLLLVSLSIVLFQDDFRKPPKKLGEERKAEVKRTVSFSAE